jgi:hypothetical protein
VTKSDPSPGGFLPLRRIVGLVESELASASRDLARRREEPVFVLGECTFSISLELAIENGAAVARFPSFLSGEDVAAERLSRVSITLRPGIAFENPRPPVFGSKVPGRRDSSEGVPEPPR